MDSTEIKHVEERVKRYWYTDGIAELASGGMFLLLGLYFGLQAYFGEGSSVSVILQVSLVAVMVAGFFGVRWLVTALKARVTYPRTGYVEYRVNADDVKRRRWVVVAVSLTIAVASMVLIDALRAVDTTVLITGLLVGTIFIALRARSSGLKRFYALGSLAVLLGVGLSFTGLEQVFNLALFYGLLGIAILLSGALVLRNYLMKHPLERAHE